ncbi:LRR receptor-like serine/threonine-protein kinase FLS2 [Klebsormidium nitens]|uniref:LRR receptor-like serine/threonine-protein kinase FLS2 n=1 Tax=Klebsormidium nitens TaxID=105231 RepID=A0A1Y1HNP2_KLENI|nr:LRR receptor-like serine/threonine-protein kinase FLS2 [Klebsormidium nitens]|eukprot:GAQ80265.1 LRR receptor-like serine/threonine-protein kinase FLS2 [Klebsormidium nitens]
MKIKAAVGSNDNGAFSSWVEGSDPCGDGVWLHITCDWSQSNPVSNKDATNYAVVVTLDLTNLNIAAPFPTDITSLTNLVTLKIGGNRFAGDLTSVNFSRLSQLQSLILDNNSLSGTIPKSLALLPSLTSINAANNGFNGIANELSALKKLKTLTLSNNPLGGQGIPSFLDGSFTALTDLQLQINRLTGVIPDQIGNMKTLRDVQLQNNRLLGSIPDLSKLNSLVLLDLSQNSLGAVDENGSLNTTSPIGIPASLSNLQALQHLDLSQNKLSGPVPDQLAYLNRLLHLDLSNNKLTGPVPTSFTNMRNLQSINLGGNQLGGAVPSFFKNMTALQEISLNGNSFTGSVPLSIFQGPSIRALDLSDNSFGGPLPVCLTTLDLTFLNLDNNQLSGTLPLELGNLSRLEILGLGYNNFTGEVPSTICNGLKNMKALDISNNRLTGNLTNSCLFDRVRYPDLHLWYDNNFFTCSADSSCPPSLVANPFKNLTLGVDPQIASSLLALAPAPSPAGFLTTGPVRNGTNQQVAPPPAAPASGATKSFIASASIFVVIAGLVALVF